MSHEQKLDSTQESEPITFAEFLESVPPSTLANISDLVGRDRYSLAKLLTPDIQLHCSSDACNGMRFFRCLIVKPSDRALQGDWEYYHLVYFCANCGKTKKVFSVGVCWYDGANSGESFKFGEWPPYGPPTPSRLTKLIGPDKELFLNGRRCENQGLGIGAFAYYRRVVENQKNRILDEIIKVSRKLETDIDTITSLQAAKAETQFSKAIKSVKDAMPQTLLINGQNPLMLLHSALSKGLHGQSDQRCLEIARSVRVVLADLSERLAQALKDEAELKDALATLMK